MTCYHYSGTCSMGTDDHSVVDPFLKGYGIEDLRVMDASVIPRTVSGNTAAATMMIAERGSHFIADGL
jgi:choline dehydrogenase